ncbi:hypothetical protein HMPREF3190_00122 [Umbribacter vaginalis]|nr:hypothetical protein HMPREF3190_00122 [Coriobacteriales bacterium DNF00809]
MNKMRAGFNGALPFALTRIPHARRSELQPLRVTNGRLLNATTVIVTFFKE